MPALSRWLLAAILYAVVLASPAGLSYGRAPARAAGAALTRSQLAADLSAALRITRTPPNLRPPLGRAAHAKPIIVLNSCSLQRSGVKSKPCIYGDRQSPKSVVLFGDSHAATWFPALDLISRQRHWRLVDFTKAGCPATEVNIQYGNVPYRQCTTWRHNAEAEIAELHPSLVIVSGARWNELVARPKRGVPTGYGSTWLNGLAATFSLLRRSAKHIVFILDVPRLNHPAPRCVSRHMLNVSNCATTRSSAIVLPAVKAGEIALANRMHIAWIDPTPWFCATTACPAIASNILLYRDDAHMTPAWSRFIAPVLADAILPIMHAAAPARP